MDSESMLASITDRLNTNLRELHAEEAGSWSLLDLQSGVDRLRWAAANEGARQERERCIQVVSHSCPTCHGTGTHGLSSAGPMPCGTCLPMIEKIRATTTEGETP